MYDELNSIFRDRVMVQCGLTYFEGTERPLSQTGFKGCFDEMFARDEPRIAERRCGGEVGSARYYYPSRERKETSRKGEEKELNVIALLDKSAKYLLSTPKSHHLTGVAPGNLHVLITEHTYNTVPRPPVEHSY